MYRITGRKYIRAACVRKQLIPFKWNPSKTYPWFHIYWIHSHPCQQSEPSIEVLDSEAACILDGFPRMYVWVGRHCNYALRNKVQFLYKTRPYQFYNVHVQAFEQLLKILSFFVATEFKYVSCRQSTLQRESGICSVKALRTSLS